MDVSGGESKAQCCKEQYCIGTWNVRSVKQGKLDVVKEEMACVNINILGTRFLFAWLLLLQSIGSRRAGFSGCGVWWAQ